MSLDAHDLVKTHYCKFPNCTNEARSAVGRYSYCDAHQGKGRKQAVDSLATKIAQLAAQAKAVDRAKEKATKATERALALKREADDLEAAFQEAAAAVMGQ